MIKDMVGCHQLLNLSPSTGDIVEKVGGAAEAAESVDTALKPVYESDPLQSLRTGINSLAESLPGLIKALDGVAKIHPFIAGTLPSCPPLYHVCSDI